MNSLHLTNNEVDNADESFSLAQRIVYPTVTTITNNTSFPKTC